MTAKDDDNGTPYSPLSAIWRVDKPQDQTCYTCGKKIDRGTLVRTYQVGIATAHVTAKPGTFNLPALDRKVTLFNRHLECLQSHNVTYVAVSHVWNRHISSLQDRASDEIDDGSEEAALAVKTMLTEAIASHDGIHRSVETPFEVWLDYLSIPQWDPDVKAKNLLVIADIFERSSFTVIHWHDVEPSAVEEIRRSDGTPTPALLEAMTQICGGAWHRRMWTAMEYLRSRRARVMLKGYFLCHDGDDLFQEKLDELWRGAGMRLGNTVELEAKAGLRRNVLPWQVRGLDSMRDSGSKDFGLSFQRLALKGCTNPHDFYYALAGLVDYKEPLLPDTVGARWQIVKGCLENQDYSPILMPSIPTWSEQRFFYGFNDLESWGLGPLVSKAKHRISIRDSRASFHAQPVGKVVFAERSVWKKFPSEPAEHFEQPARIVLGHVGSDIEHFVLALCLRIMGTNPWAVLRLLRHRGRLDAVQEMLETLDESSPPWPKEMVLQVISEMSLDDPKLDFNELPEDKEKQPGFAKSWIDVKQGTNAPIKAFMMNGTSIHLSEKSGFVGMVCPGCAAVVTTRAALYKAPTKLLGATGFRIPGLRYDRTLPDGIGILVKDGQIVGRFIFCCPCCPDVATQEVQVELPDFPLPVGNPVEYRGNDT